MRTRAFRIGLLTGFIALFAAHGTAAQERQQTQPMETATEGVAVHGHWKIEVVRDGQVIKKLEFQNALTGTGQVVLSKLLTGDNSVSGEYRVRIQDLDASTLECDDITTNVGECATDVQSTQGDGSQVLLEVSFSVTSAGTISRVLTAIEECASSTTPDTCDSGSFLVYSQTDLSTAESVQSGDTVNVSVLFTFS